MPNEWRALYRRTFASVFRKPTPKDGYSLIALKKAEARLGIRLPRALRDYYLLIGRHRLNQAHNRLLAPTELLVGSRHLVFLEENQGVVSWGVAADTNDDDPAVLQAQDAASGPWFTEKARCSQFMCAMFCWQAVGGGLPHHAGADKITKSTVLEVKRHWPIIAQMRDLVAFGGSGQVVCVVKSGKNTSLAVAGRSKKDIEQIQNKLDIEFPWISTGSF